MDVYDSTLNQQTVQNTNVNSSEVLLTLEDTEENTGELSLTLDSNGQYEFITESDGLTYRVLHLSSTEEAQQYLDSLITTQDQTNQVQSINTENEVEEEVTYHNLDDVPSRNSINDNNNNLEKKSHKSDPVYVMVNSQEILKNAIFASNRPIKPNIPESVSIIKSEPIFPSPVIIVNEIEDNGMHNYFADFKGIVSRDDRRRATHNEVERRRRDKINTWIMQLAEMMPETASNSSNRVESSNKSKSVILSKACDYILQLQNANMDLEIHLKVHENVMDNLMSLKQQLEKLKQENYVLRTQVMQSQQNVPVEVIPMENESDLEIQQNTIISMDYKTSSPD